jgi:hypothetical protein
MSPIGHVLKGNPKVILGEWKDPDAVNALANALVTVGDLSQVSCLPETKQGDGFSKSLGKSARLLPEALPECSDFCSRRVALLASPSQRFGSWS